MSEEEGRRKSDEDLSNNKDRKTRQMKPDRQGGDRQAKKDKQRQREKTLKNQN